MHLMVIVICKGARENCKCSDDIWRIIEACWNRNPTQRPSWTTLHQMLTRIYPVSIHIPEKKDKEMISYQDPPPNVDLNAPIQNYTARTAGQAIEKTPLLANNRNNYN